MAKLYFRYSAMNSGKTTALIQAAFNYEERGMHPVVVKPAVDTKGGDNIVTRLGISRKVDVMLKPNDIVAERLDAEFEKQPFACVLVDEVQFITAAQAEEFFWYAVTKNVPILAYGLRADFSTTGFPGSTRMLELAHEVQELKTICRCGKKALFNGRKVNGEFVREGSQVEIDDQASVEYESLCADDYRKLVLKQTS